ncbi:HesB/YadR/YfhF family protein [Salimicrobium sp. PL1-032A]|uniref:HesB/YadR/YfhF family protein n=1 Tax=Salimicrobium sp. PL1-032A TaxID=3095364 RepID=UPI003261A1E0
MDLTVTKDAAKWYKEELELNDSDSMQFYVRYGGAGGLQPGFSLGIKVDTPYEAVAETNVEGITFYVEKSDEWYFDTYSLHVSYDEKWEEPDFSYE